MSETSYIPPEYEGREQTFLKHQVLKQYLSSWVQKLARTYQHGRIVRLWYVDCFAGPWQAAGENLEDTSIAIGLRVLRVLREVIESMDHKVRASAIFIEKDPKSFQELKRFLNDRDTLIDVHAFPGEFGSNVDRINELVHGDPAFIFIDPTGWKGVGMRFIAPLLDQPRRDVLINVMFNDLHRFKGDPRDFLREQMCEFFGIEDSAELRGMSEAELMSLYRHRVKELSGAKYCLDLAIPHPVQERTWFYLVVAGRHPALVKLFRSVEGKVAGEIAGEVRREAKRRASPAPGQSELNFGKIVSDYRYDKLKQEASESVPRHLRSILSQFREVPYGELWPGLLEQYHLTLSDLNKLIMEMHRNSDLVVTGLKPRERTPKDDYRIRLRE